jgi:putative transcriptional regulator
MNFIARYRKVAGLSQRELGTRCGNWIQSRISMYEVGARTPDIENCKKIVMALRAAGADCSLDDVFPVDENTV